MYKSFLLIALTTGAVNAEKLSFQENLSLTTDRISALDVIHGAGDIDIRAYQGKDIQVKATITSKKYRSMERFKEVFERDMVFDLDRESEYAVLRGHSKRDVRKNPEIQINFDIQIPNHLDVDIDDGSGSIRVADIAGYLSIDDGSGDIHVSHVDNNLDIDDGSGDIHIEQVTGTIEIEDGSGSVHISDSEGDVDIDDGSGNISLVQVHGEKEIDDGSGKIHLANSSGDVSIDDGSGDIILDEVSGSATLSDGSGDIIIDALGGALTIKGAGSGKVIIDGENRTKAY